MSDKSTVETQSVGKLNITEDMIKVDPFGRNPLTALVKVKMPVKGRFKISVKGKTQAGVTISNTFEKYDDYHEIPVLGLYEDHANEVEFSFLNGEGQVRASQTIVIRTEKILPAPPVISILTKSVSTEYRGLYYPANSRYGFDQNGDIRWYYTGDIQYFFGRLKNGNVLITSFINIVLYHSHAFYEVTVLGEIVKKYDVPNLLHHDIVEKPDGNFLVLSNSTPFEIANNGLPEEDYIVEIDRRSGAIVKHWDFNDILDTVRPYLPSNTKPDDWLHLNGVYYDPTDNSIVASGRSQSAVVKIDYSTGAIKWILGSHGQWSSRFQPYLLKPVNANGQPLTENLGDFWFYGQHSPKPLSNGNIIVYDNGDNRGFYDNQVAGTSEYTRLVEYKIDEVNKTVKIVSEYNADKSVFSRFQGSVDHLASTNSSLIGFTTEPSKIVEIDQSNTVLFEARIEGPVIYRGYRVNLYGDE